MNLVLLTPSEIDAQGNVVLVDRRHEHLTSVLRVDPGQTVRIGVIDGPRGTATVEQVNGERIELRCTLETETPPRPAVDLLLALPRPKVLRRLWAQLAALGVDRIVLTNAARVERHYFDTHVLSPSCYEPLLLEGLQQARDTRVPRVSIHRRFRVLVEDELDALCPGGLRVAAHPSANGSIAPALTARPASRVVLAVGPEGGWTGFELDLLAAHGFGRISAGPRTLRTDTAVIALLALAHEVLRAPNREP
jgi:16S rRNA (uracil1498-N3)-methyltransferase